MTNITIEKKGVSINNKLIQFPLSIDSLSAILNKPKWDKNMARYIWNELGIFVRAADKKNVELIAIHFKAGQEPDDPKLPFDGEITVEGQNINKVDFPKGQFFDKQIGSIEIFGVREGKKIVEITIIPSEADSLAEPLENQIDPDKYVIKKTKGAKIKFYDFNFKITFNYLMNANII